MSRKKKDCTKPECTREWGEKQCESAVRTKKCSCWLTGICVSEANNGFYRGIHVYKPSPVKRYSKKNRPPKGKKNRRPRPKRQRRASV